MAQLPLTIAGRSPFDPIRLRWGGFGTILLGVLIVFTAEIAGIVFGIILILLGLATWRLSGFGRIGWFDIPAPHHYIVGAGAIIGFIFLNVFLLLWISTGKMIQMIARNL